MIFPSLLAASNVLLVQSLSQPNFSELNQFTPLSPTLLMAMFDYQRNPKDKPAFVDHLPALVG